MYVPQLGIEITIETEEQLIEQAERNIRNYPANITTLQASLRTDILIESENFQKGSCWRVEIRLTSADALTGNARTNAYKSILYGLRNERLRLLRKRATC